ncbi:hypothetical protein CEXT_643231 [Caerostris extrusa]|uniref:Uncharacterized protein n=1 Tax=Caerostris extrusa TaxID=172846 RepID=A0AAV4SV57_CAEEX|nr:hypothetical protein CEXT_643231 [Caerostris extrusa]
MRAEMVISELGLVKYGGFNIFRFKCSTLHNGRNVTGSHRNTKVVLSPFLSLFLEIVGGKKGRNLPFSTLSDFWVTPQQSTGAPRPREAGRGHAPSPPPP